MLFSAAPRPESGVEGVVEAVVFAAAVSALHAAAAAQHVALLTLTAFGARVGAVERRGEVGAGGRARAGANLVVTELWTRQSCEAEREEVRRRRHSHAGRSVWSERTSPQNERDLHGRMVTPSAWQARA